MYLYFTRRILPFLVLLLFLPMIGFAESPGIWMSSSELSALPMSGPAWQRLKSAADSPLTSTPDLSSRAREGVQVLAKALSYAKTSNQDYRREVINAVMAVIGTEGRDPLATFRALGTYVIAADLVGVPGDKDQAFRDWIRKFLYVDYDVGGRSLVRTHETEKANNWGTAAGFSRAAVAAYLRRSDGDAELARVVKVFKGWLGDASSYVFPAGAFNDLSWQHDPNKPVGINPKGSMKEGHSIDGVLPDDQRRSGGFSWPPPKENYVYTALQGTVPTAVILCHVGYPDVWEWEDQAILRAFKWLYEQAQYKPEGDDVWLTYVVDCYYRTGGRFMAGLTPSGAGKTADWTDWTHVGGAAGNTAPLPPQDLRVHN